MLRRRWPALLAEFAKLVRQVQRPALDSEIGMQEPLSVRPRHMSVLGGAECLLVEIDRLGGAIDSQIGDDGLRHARSLPDGAGLSPKSPTFPRRSKTLNRRTNRTIG